MRRGLTKQDLTGQSLTKSTSFQNLNLIVAKSSAQILTESLMNFQNRMRAGLMKAELMSYDLTKSLIQNLRRSLSHNLVEQFYVKLPGNNCQTVVVMND